MGLTDKPRASPEALLALANREGRGRLKIFLGAAPGVGKTYAMLQAARVAAQEGTDVAVGLAETHGRRETELLLEGLRILPRTSVPYRGRMVQEFDLDAALKCRPELILVDEYAHTNAAGSRHPKRWQDIEELLDAGINVWTTLNIQHLESLNDVVQRITRVRVRETVPDANFDKADEIVLVDLPPDELLKRLAEGKVYVQDTAARAVDNFFRPNNLVALRELALRRAAARIDSDLLERMQGGGVEGPWAAGERILVCVGPDETSSMVVRHAKRLADMIGAPFIAVTVEWPSSRFSEKQRHRVTEALQLAESLGADEVKTLVGTDLVDELLRYAKFENVTQIVVGRSRSSWLAELLGRSFPHQLIRAAEDIAIHVVTPVSTERRSVWQGLEWRSLSKKTSLAFLWSAVAVVLAIFVGRVIAAAVPLPNVSMVFLLAVFFSAVQFGIWPAVFASVLSFLGYNFFFIAPFYTLTVARPHELLALFIFLGVAVLSSAVAGRAREQGAAAASRARATRRLFEFARRLSSLAEPQTVADSTVAEVHRDLGLPAVILFPQGDDLVVTAAWPPEDQLGTATMTAARWAFERDEPAGAGTGTLPNVPWYFFPLRASHGRVGVIGIACGGKDGAELDAEERALFETLAELTATALERSQLAREIVVAKSATEAEKVRNTFLASISHDFRTPLASILGSATSLIEYRAKLPDAAKLDLLSQIKDEAEHLDGMVRNLLAMTRVEAGALELRRDWIDVRELLDRIVAFAKRRGAVQGFTVRTEDDLPFAPADQTLLDQAMTNVVGNAVRYGGPDAQIVVEARRVGDDLLISVADDGPGVAPDMLPHIFEKFMRGKDLGMADGGEGAGLGLAIAKGIVEAHGGTISADSHVIDGHGTRVTLRLPLGTGQTL
ncbi:sensor histidine kinase [Microvirga terricola]|uniref:histidine kinase n=1 Tax=Microvirga terricola TaxID=2719797 RepID=A0ABX0VFG8_9HYPH|nr:sensor histidine kinase KdpD [Microvirga terricola]NIX78251.1 sensor histidine kinase KdpD [Microvirga terricola]